MTSGLRPCEGKSGTTLRAQRCLFWYRLPLPGTIQDAGGVQPPQCRGCPLKVQFRRRRRGKPGNGALGEFGTLLRLVFGSAAATVAAYLDRLDPATRTRASSGAEDA